MKRLYLKCLLVFIFSDLWQLATSNIEIIQLGTRDTLLLIGNSQTFSINISGYSNESFTINLIPQNFDIISVSPSSFIFENGTVNDTASFCVLAENAGHSELNFNITPSYIYDANNLYLRITGEKNELLPEISSIIGWLYFTAWSVSFYPQIIMNYKRKSVVGLNFDFVYLNIVGFCLYSLFNIGLYFIPAIQVEYHKKHSRSVIPVQIHDIVFSVHAALATTIVIIQCFIYERNNQRVSAITKGLLSVFALTILISCILAATSVIWWLDFLLYCSYIKLTITLIKYLPQAYMNYKRKSTIGWSIGNILLDFTGGMLSMVEMALNAYNYNDWVSILTDPTKFGLGFFSVAFDIFFLIQHYILYRNRYEELPGSVLIHEDAIENPENELPT